MEFPYTTENQQHSTHFTTNHGTKWNPLIPRRVPLIQQRALRLIFDQFANKIGVLLSSFWRAPVQVSVEDMEQTHFCHFWRSLTDPSFFSSFEILPTNLHAFMEVDPAIVYGVITRMLGQEGKIPHIGHDLNEMGISLYRKMTARFLQEFREAWEPIGDFHFAIRELHTQLPKTIPISKGTLCMTVYFKVQFSQFNSFMALAFPNDLLSLFGDELEKYAYTHPQTETWTKPVPSLKETLNMMEVEVKAVLGNVDLSLEDFKEIQVGDILDLGISVFHPLKLCVEDQPVFNVLPGLFGKQKGVFIIKPPLQEKTE